MKNIVKCLFISCFFLLGGMVGIAQPQATVEVGESLGLCELATDCDQLTICVDITLRMSVARRLDSYNIMVEYDGSIISREAFNSNNALPIGDNSCVIDNGDQDTDIETPTMNPDHWRVAGVPGSPITMAANVPITVHTICFKILQPALLNNQVICVGGSSPIQTTVTTTAIGGGNPLTDDDVPEVCMVLDESFISCSLLPIQLLDFTAERFGSTALLDWSTANESNSAYFEIQRAGEDRQFTAIGKASGAGSSTSIQTYRYVDASPFSGINFYRLRQVDFDGAYTYSPIRSLQFTSRAPGLSISPNPTRDGFYVNADDGNLSGFEVKVIDLQGRLITTVHAEAHQQNVWIDLDRYLPGVYHVIVTGSGFQWNDKIVKSE